MPTNGLLSNHFEKSPHVTLTVRGFDKVSEAAREGRPSMPWDISGYAVLRALTGRSGPDVIPLRGISRVKELLSLHYEQIRGTGTALCWNDSSCFLDLLIVIHRDGCYYDRGARKN
ncbi:hypothetical protein J6590_044813 [Homalodisca vitripennis]|nr:hypothetical protein J6590_044813 [Homalodisca vitripennis]